jgi:protein-tyrosine phosphatase
MLPLADTHVHLLAGLDDGPPDDDTALAMCRMLTAGGCRFAAALAHQNPTYPQNTAARLTTATQKLATQLAEQKVPLTVYPTGEVMLSADLVADWKAGALQSYGGHGKHLLVEMPHGQYLDVRRVAAGLRAEGVTPVVAHAERYEELLFDPPAAEAVVAAGCLIQVSAGEIAEPSSPRVEKALKDWAKRGLIHLLGSDGHGLDRRRPEMRAGAVRLASWVGPAAADRIGSIWGQAVLEGRPVRPPKPLPKPRNWFAKLFGG